MKRLFMVLACDIFTAVTAESISSASAEPTLDTVFQNQFNKYFKRAASCAPVVWQD